MINAVEHKLKQTAAGDVKCVKCTHGREQKAREREKEKGGGGGEKKKKRNQQINLKVSEGPGRTSAVTTHFPALIADVRLPAGTECGGLNRIRTL